MGPADVGFGCMNGRHRLLWAGLWAGRAGLKAAQAEYGHRAKIAAKMGRLGASTAQVILSQALSAGPPLSAWSTRTTRPYLCDVSEAHPCGGSQKADDE